MPETWQCYADTTYKPQARELTDVRLPVSPWFGPAGGWPGRTRRGSRPATRPTAPRGAAPLPRKPAAELGRSAAESRFPVKPAA